MNTVIRSEDGALLELFRTAVETSSVMAWVSDALGGNYFLNDAWLRFTGQSRSAAAELGWLPVIDPNDRSQATSVTTAAVLSGCEFQLALNIRNSNGDRVPVMLRGAPVRNSDQDLVGYFGTIMVDTKYHDNDQKIVGLLTAREREVLNWAALGETSDQIGERLGISGRTVDIHIKQACIRLGAGNRVHAVAMAIRNGEISV